MENTTTDMWMNVLDIFHYIFLIALLGLIVVYVYRIFSGKSTHSKIKSHSRSNRRKDTLPNSDAHRSDLKN